MSFLLLLTSCFVFAIFIGVITALVVRKKSHNQKVLWITIGVVTSPIVFIIGSVISIVFIFSLFFVGLGVLILLEDYKPFEITEEKVLTECDRDSKIIEVKYGAYDQTFYPVYFQKGDKKIGLMGSLSNLANANPDKNFDSDHKNPISDNRGFSFLEFMQKGDFHVINQEKMGEAKSELEKITEYIATKNKKYEKSKNSPYDSFAKIKAIYINSEKVDKNEFEEMLDCAKKLKGQDVIPDVMVYTKNENFADEFYFDTLICENPRNKIQINFEGRIYFEGVIEQPANSIALNYSSGGQQNFDIGYFDVDGNLVRDSEPDKSFQVVKRGKYYDTLEESGFATAYEKQQIIALLFNQNQEPINDYLQTCKNAEGKNVFNLFQNAMDNLPQPTNPS